jgi:hypothetical protein
MDTSTHIIFFTLLVLLRKDVAFDFNEKCIAAFQTLKNTFISAPIIQPPDWNQPFEIMCDASDYAVGKEWKARYMLYITLLELLMKLN